MAEPLKSLSQTVAVTEPVETCPFETLPLNVRVLIATDGTVTDMLEAMHGESIDVRLLGQQLVNRESPHSGHSGTTLIRSVLLVGVTTGTSYAHAESAIAWDLLEDPVREELAGGQMSIGRILQRHRIETIREGLWWGRQRAGALGELLGRPADEYLYARCYQVCRQRAPILTITERFVGAPRPVVP